MMYAQVQETLCAGRVPQAFPRTQRELVEFSLRVNPVKTVRPLVERDHPRGIFR